MTTLTRALRRRILFALGGGGVGDLTLADIGTIIAEVKDLPITDETVYWSDVRRELEALGWSSAGCVSYGTEHWFRGFQHMELDWSGSQLRATRYAPADLLDGLLAEFDEPPAKVPAPAALPEAKP